MGTKTSQHHHKHRIGHKHGEGSNIDIYSYQSKINHWNPTFKVLFSLITLFLCIGLNTPYVSLAVIIAMAYLTIIKGGFSLREYLHIMRIPFAFIIIGTIAIAVNFSKQPLGDYHLHISFFYIYTSNAKIKEMIFLILKAYGAVSALEMMALSTPSSEIISVLRKAHVPKIFVEMMSMIYRYIFLLFDVHSNMRNSAKSRLGYCNLKTSYYTFGSIISNMLVVSLKKANASYDAMEARCYDGEIKFLEEDKELSRVHVAAGALFCISFILIRILTV